MAQQRTLARNRRRLDPSVPKKLTPAIISSMTLSGSNAVQIAFSTRVQAAGLPGFSVDTGDNDETVASISTIDTTTLLLTFTGDIAGATMSVDEGDPGIRTPAGGFVPAGNYTLPAV